MHTHLRNSKGNFAPSASPLCNNPVEEMDGGECLLFIAPGYLGSSFLFKATSLVYNVLSRLTLAPTAFQESMKNKPGGHSISYMKNKPV